MIKALNTNEKPISAVDVIENYPKFQKRVQQYSDAKTGGRMDMLKYTSDSIVDWVKSDKKPLTKDQSKNLGDFLNDIPKDLAFGLVRELYLEERTRSVIDDNTKLIKQIAEKRNIEYEG